MLQSLYDGASALHVLHRQHQETAHNLANLNTNGFKRAYLSVQEKSGSHYLPNHQGHGPQIERRNIDFTQGRLEETRRPLDAAISGDAFFALQTQDGREVYSRNGRFFRAMGSDNISDGTLITDSNLQVLGEGGSPLSIPASISIDDINIGLDGSITAGDQQIGKLKIVAFENNQALEPISQSLFRRTAGTVETEADVEVRQKHLEASNVNSTSELISLIVGGRLYEAVQKATSTISNSLEQSIRS